MQKEQTTMVPPLTIKDVAIRFMAGGQLTRQEVAVIEANRAATEEFVAICKRLLARESGALRRPNE